MTNIRITNNSEARYGVEQVGGGYVWLRPGATKSLDAANVPALQLRDDLEVVIDAKLDAPPARLRVKADQVGKADPLDHDGDGKKGGSKRGAASTRTRGARRRKAPTK